MESDLWLFEKEAVNQGYHAVAGVDEVGRGPLAGPVISAAVILPANFSADGITDSKKLTPRKRDRFYDIIYEQALSVGIGIIEPLEIDRVNILQASLRAMVMAIENLRPDPDYVLIDGSHRIPMKLPQQTITKGDSRSISVAAASIVAKVTRDRLMERYQPYYPEYGFPGHKGYPTKAHKTSIREWGVSPIHRRSFRGVKEFCEESGRMVDGSLFQNSQWKKGPRD